MPIKSIVLVKRKPGMSPEEFRHRYETGHSRLAIRLFGHLWSEYRRHYLVGGGTFAGAGGFSEATPPPYDAIAEVVFPDMAAIEENNRIFGENKEEILADEEATFDRANSWVLMIDTVEEDLPKAVALERAKVTA